jgi:glycosyltransferase involved in cell wall biosynthesis
MVDFIYSAIVPVHNASETLTRCIESIVTQRNHPAEIIIYNDASTDNSRMLIERIIESTPIPIKYMESGANKGVSVARNSAASLSELDYFIFFDSDDSSAPFRAEEHLRLFNLGADFTYVSSNKYYSSQYEVPQINENFVGILEYQKMFEKVFFGINNDSIPKCSIPASTLGVKSSVFNFLGGFDESLKRLEDVDLALKGCLAKITFGFSSTIAVTRYTSNGDYKNEVNETFYKKRIISKYSNILGINATKLAILNASIHEAYFGRKFFKLFYLGFISFLLKGQSLTKLKQLYGRVKHDFKKR